MKAWKDREFVICVAWASATITLGAILLPDAARTQEISSAFSGARPLRLTGSLSATTTRYSVSGINGRRQPFSWLVSGNLTLSIYGLSFPVSLTVSEQQRDFRQPFNRYGISPSYKWATVHAGYRNLNFSRYTLAGVVFLGGAIELNPGPLRLGAMYGRLQKAIEEDTTASFPSTPAYERHGYGLKVGVGSDNSFVDFILFRARDDSASLKRQPSTVDLLPAENLVLGVHTRFRIAGHVTFEGEAAGSFYTRDVRSPVVKDVDNEALKFISKFYTVRSSTQANLAARAALDLSLGRQRLRLQYQRVEPDYTSLGTYFFNTDVEEITVAPTFTLLGGKLNLSGSVGRLWDNLNNKKRVRTVRTVGSANLAWNPSQFFGLQVQYGNYSTGQRAGSRALNDSLRVQNVSQNLMVVPRLMYLAGSASHTITASFSYQRFEDQNRVNPSAVGNETLITNFSYILNFPQSGWSFGLTGSGTRSTTAGRLLQVLSANINLTGSFLERNLTWTLAGSGARNDFEGRTTSVTFNARSRLTLNVAVLGSISLEVAYLRNEARAEGARTFNEFTTQLAVSKRFNY